MSLFGFRREDIARQLSDFAKKDLVANYPQGPATPSGVSDFVSGRQSATDPELYLFYSDIEIPPANKVVDQDNPNDFKWQCGVSSTPQRIYKPRIRNDAQYNEIGQDVDAVRLNTFEDLAGGNYATASYFVYNPWDHPIRAKEIGICMVIGGVLFGFQSANRRRIRFRLYSGFNDTGTALADVLDSWGDSSLCGTQVTVCDPRKLFAHAVGSTHPNITPLHDKNAAMSSMLHAGGSVGYAIETFECEGDPLDCATECVQPTECYPRFEVEQCTQSVNKMRVFIDKYSAFPKGQSSTESKTLKVFPDQSFASQWPYVDFPTNLQVTTGSSGDEYSIDAVNVHRFSAYTGWAVIERVDWPSRLQNALNRCVPYTGGLGTRTEEWHIVDVEKPIARFICTTFIANSGGGSPLSDTWEYAGQFFEGEDPTPYFIDPDTQGSSINDYIETLPCLNVDCLGSYENGLAFWDPNDQKYYVFATDSALYGRAKDYEIIGQPKDAGNDLIYYGQDCDLNYKVRQFVKMFGDKQPSCPALFVNRTTSPSLSPISVVQDVKRYGGCYIGGVLDPTKPDEGTCVAAGGDWVYDDTLCFDYKKIFVCKTEDLLEECINVCCEPTPPTPPPSPCIYCQECPEGFIEFSTFLLSWTGVDSGNGIFDGRAKNETIVWTASPNDCCANLAVTLESDDPLIADQPVTATVCVAAKDQSCAGSGFWQLNLTWSQPDYAGVTLPTVMCGGMQQFCAGSYGIVGGAGIVPSVPNPTSGFWDEASASLVSCEP